MGMGAATPLALVAQSATADALVDCIGRRLAATGPAPIPLAQLSSGLEARIGVHELPPRIATASLSLKPAPDFMSGVHHDDDPEAHPEIVKALLGRMRIPLITRAWAWQGKDGLETCLGIAKWLGSESRRPVVLDPD